MALVGDALNGDNVLIPENDPFVLELRRQTDEKLEAALRDAQTQYFTEMRANPDPWDGDKRTHIYRKFDLRLDEILRKSMDEFNQLLAEERAKRAGARVVAAAAGGHGADQSPVGGDRRSWQDDFVRNPYPPSPEETRRASSRSPNAAGPELTSYTTPPATPRKGRRTVAPSSFSSTTPAVMQVPSPKAAQMSPKNSPHPTPSLTDSKKNDAKVLPPISTPPSTKKTVTFALPPEHASSSPSESAKKLDSPPPSQVALSPPQKPLKAQVSEELELPKAPSLDPEAAREKFALLEPLTSSQQYYAQMPEFQKPLSPQEARAQIPQSTTSSRQYFSKMNLAPEDFARPKIPPFSSAKHNLQRWNPPLSYSPPTTTVPMPDVTRVEPTRILHPDPMLRPEPAIPYINHLAGRPLRIPPALATPDMRRIWRPRTTSQTSHGPYRIAPNTQHTPHFQAQPLRIGPI